MHEPQDEIPQPNREDEHIFDLEQAYTALAKAFYRIEYGEQDSREDDHA